MADLREFSEITVTLNLSKLYNSILCNSERLQEPRNTMYI